MPIEPKSNGKRNQDFIFSLVPLSVDHVRSLWVWISSRNVDTPCSRPVWSELTVRLRALPDGPGHTDGNSLLACRK
jgi:hypothetical protein